MVEKKILNVASYKRINSLIKTIESIYHQCDEINICLNNYDGDIPKQFLDEKINLIFTDNSKGDAFKFLNLENSDGYYLTIDDDLIYPPNYVEYMISNCKKYNNKKIITLHGKNFDEFPIISYYNSKKQIYHFLDEQNKDIKVQYGGTGVMCFHTSLLKTSIEYFKYPNMADVWIGNLAKNNNLEIICVSRPKNFITQIGQTETIYNSYSNNDKIQTNLVNLTYSVKNLSIIIPTYKNTEYIDECINSILESSENLNVELLIGIDACEDTLNHIKAKNYPDFIRFYYFNENVGPYLIKNSLVNRTSSDNILFFDSDDIMLKPTLTTIVKNIQKYECVKLKLQNYTNNTITKNNVNYGEGVFAINKQLFLLMNGFEPWRVAADSDFMGRLYSRRLRIYHIPEVSFYYRQHPTSLTQRGDTGMSSRLRANYVNISKNKKGSENPEVLHIANFTQITIDTYEIPKEFDYNNIIRREKLDSVLNPTPRKTIEKPQKKQFSEPTTTRLDELFKNTSNPARIIKTNKPQNRQELIDLKNNTTKKTMNELFPKKPNYKEGKNFINVGGKFTK